MSNNANLGPSLSVVKACVEREICEANIYRQLLFQWINGIIGNKAFNDSFRGIFHYVRDALETKYVLALGKIFSPSNEAGLWCLVQLAKQESSDKINLRMERYPTAPHDQLRRQRHSFLSEFDQYVAEIKKIRTLIKPLRNVQRAHNVPWSPLGSKSTWDETGKWILFAETVFEQAMDGVCESSMRVGHFYPSELNAEIEWFISIIKTVKLKPEFLTLSLPD